MEDWIVSVGEHEGVINSELWIDTQKRLRENGKLSFRKPQKTTAFFSGVVRCKACGGYMRPKSSRKAKDGTSPEFLTEESYEDNVVNLFALQMNFS